MQNGTLWDLVHLLHKNMFKKTITYTELKHCDILFYRPMTLFGYLIGFFTSMMRGKFDRVTFSHGALVLKDPDHLDDLKRFDAMEGYKTGFREEIGKAYVFRFKSLTEEEAMLIQEYCMSRKGSDYDRPGIFQFLKDIPIFKPFFKNIQEDEFRDFCCELQKNAFVNAKKMKDCEKIIPHDLYERIRQDVDFVGLIL